MNRTGSVCANVGKPVTPRRGNLGESLSQGSELSGIVVGFGLHHSQPVSRIGLYKKYR